MKKERWNEKNFEVPVEELRKTIDPETLELDEKGKDIMKLGQRVAHEAIEVSVGIEDKHYNVYVAGPEGIGKTLDIKKQLEEIAAGGEVPPDLIYVQDFKNPDGRKVLKLPAGQGKEFKKDMKVHIEELKKILAEMRSVGEREIIGNIKKKKEEAYKNFKEKMDSLGAKIKEKPGGQVDIFLFTKDGKPIDPDMKLPEEEKKELSKKMEIIEKEIKGLKNLMQSLDIEEKAMLEQMEEKEKGIIKLVVKNIVKELLKKCPKAARHLVAVKEDILKNIKEFQKGNDTPGTPHKGRIKISLLDSLIADKGKGKEEESDFFGRYDVDVIVDNSRTKGAPVVFADKVTRAELFGEVKEKIIGDFYKIKAGALHRANGGYLIIRMDDILAAPFWYDIWMKLKETLRTQEIKIEGNNHSLFISTLDLEAVPIKVKVVLVGSYELYLYLQEYDEDFKRLFRILSHFRSTADLKKNTQDSYVRWILNYCRGEGLEIDKPAMARLIEHTMEIAENQKKLSLQMSKIKAIVKEAEYWASGKTITLKAVEKALKEKEQRCGLLQKAYLENIKVGCQMIWTKGTKIGEVNALSLIPLSDDTVVKTPDRVAAETSVRESNEIKLIDSKVKLDGPMSQKAIEILTANIEGRFGKDRILFFKTTLTFEQTYGIEGPSASLAEAIVILSSLGNIPIRQDLAITGTMGVKGESGVIGGVNHKIEGFFKACKMRRLTGTQGVVIPRANRQHLMLPKEIVEAVRDRKFHIYQVSNYHEAMWIFSGLTPKQVNERIERALDRYEKVIQKYNQAMKGFNNKS